jgi:hypothetical protein
MLVMAKSLFSSDMHDWGNIELTPASAERAGQRVPLDRLQSRLLREAYNTWDLARGERMFPSRTEMTPQRMRRFLRNVFLLRVIDGGRDYQYRVVGEAQIQAFGWDCAGQSVDELDAVVPGMTAVMRPLFDKIVKTKAPLAFEGYLSRSARHDLQHETLFLPLGASDDAVDHILNVSAYQGET